MEIYTYDVTAARRGAAFWGARTPWTSIAVVGATHALAPNPVLAVGSPDARHAAFRPSQALRQRAMFMAAEPLPADSDIRKQTNVHKTRSNAGGYGAMGPHPEWERLA